MFPPFSPKVVEPINGEIMMTINKKEAEDKQMQFQQWKKEGCFEKEDDKTIITGKITCTICHSRLAFSILVYVCMYFV